MNKIISVICILVMVLGKSQVTVGKGATTNSSVSLEFGNDLNRGIVLPYVENKTLISQNGTLIFDTTDKKVKYLKNGSWSDLSVDTTGVVDLSTQNTKSEQTKARVIIGASSGADGILVLEDTTKAMILPKVASPHLTIIKPASGMMVYDTSARQLAVYNGSVWTFWKPE